MKIGTITFWWCHENYGQVLQVFAFQHFLKSHGHEPFLIRYMAKSFFARATVGGMFWRLFFNPIGFVKATINYINGNKRAWLQRQERVRKRRDFEGFRNKYLSMTHGLYCSFAELSEADSDDIGADMYTVGSDIVWKNFPLTDDGRPMFLDFGNKDARRVAYSASFGGIRLSKAYIHFVAPLLASLDAVGVREIGGVGICKTLGRSDAVHVIDPVLLLKREDYLYSFGLSGSCRNGIFCYYLQSDRKIPYDYLRRIAEGAKVSVATVYDDMGVPTRDLVDPTIPQWIDHIANAKLFVTNSFHGASLSIIMHTPFIVLLKHNGEGMDSRLLSLLKTLGLDARIYRGDSFEELSAIAKSEIDWKDVDVRLDAERQKSISFLKKVGI